jgi:hypothetical protein
VVYSEDTPVETQLEKADNAAEKGVVVSKPLPDGNREIVAPPPSVNDDESKAVKKEDFKRKALSTRFGLETRTSTFKLLQLFNNFSEAKKACFKTCALGHFLGLAIGRLPKYYAHYVVSQCNHRSLKFVVADRSSFMISAKNVKLTLGLPMGPRSMSGLPSNKAASIKKWSAQFDERVKEGKKKKDISMSELKALILDTEDEDLGPDFIRNVLLYIINAVIWSPGSDSVYLDPLPFLEDVDNIKEYNWCQFVIDKVVAAGEKWTAESPYCGPLLFLIVSEHFLFTFIKLLYEQRFV